MNMHPKGSARFLCGSTVVAHMHKPREMDLSMSAHSCLVLVTEATLQAAISEIGQTLQKKPASSAILSPEGRAPEPQRLSRQSLGDINVFLHSNQSCQMQKNIQICQRVFIHSRVQMCLCWLFVVSFDVRSQCLRIFGNFAAVATTLLHR